MDSTNMCNLQTFGQSTMGQNQQVYEYSRLNLTAVSREQSADIAFVTKEGDKVTLSADSSFEAAYATYDHKAQLKSTYTESMGQLSSLAVERDITISVEGDLNDQEKKEIKKVMREIFKMMNDFLAGRSDNPDISAAKNIDLDTLATVEAKFEVKKTVLEVNQTTAEVVTDSSIPARESKDARPMKRLIDRMVDAVKDSKVEHDRFLKFFEHRPFRLSDAYMEQEPDARRMRKMVRRIMGELFHQLGNMPNIAGDIHHLEDLANENTILKSETV